MKKTFLKYFILIAVLLVFTVCQNPSDTVYMAPGTGLVSLTINNADNARTILPTPQLSDFMKIVLIFTPTTPAGDPEIHEWTNSSIQLAEGTYNLEVTAYADTDKQKPAAQGSETGIVVIADQITPVTVSLGVTFGIEGIDEGTFSWNITYGVGVTVNSAAMTISPLKGTGSPAQTVAPLNNLGSLTLNSGEYRVEFSLRDSQGRTAELTEILHVYKNLTSTFSHIFSTSNFHFQNVRKITFTGSTANIELTGLVNNDVYLVKVNTSADVVSAVNTGNAVLSSSSSLKPSASPPSNNTPDIVELPRMGHPEADKFNANPPPIVNWQGPQGSLAQTADVREGDIRHFWVEQYYNANPRNWVSKQATLEGQGDYSNVWVMYDGIAPGKVETVKSNAKAVAAKFDEIYIKETNILGYEYGGGPGGNRGIDGDIRIQILIYPIVNSSGEVQAGGYFWSKDYYPENYSSTLKSNEAEIFYIDSSQSLQYTYSTLAHELQHMIHFNRKYLDKRLSTANTWYNEMLSAMTEDVMANIIGVPYMDPSHIIHQRISYGFRSSYSSVGVTEWDLDDPSDNYEMVFAFGAYLMRNYGGVLLLSKIMDNNAVGIPSITAALNEFYEGMTFEDALIRFGETLIYTDQRDGVVTFNQAIDDTIEGIRYTARNIELWSTFEDPGDPRSYNYTPIISSVAQREMRPNSISVQSDNTWKNRTGVLPITLQKPANGVVFFLMVK